MFAGALDAVRMGNGFLFIPSQSFTHTSSKTSTTIPSETATPTKTLIPTSTINISSVKTNAVRTVWSEIFSTETAKTPTNTPSATNTPKSTVDLGSIETNAIVTYFAGMTKTREAVTPTNTSSVVTNDKGFLEKRIGTDNSMMVQVIDGKNFFWIDKYEVTNDQYSRCVEDGWCTLPGIDSDHERSSVLSLNQYSDYPIVNIDWIQAGDYCSWAGKQLVSDEQWVIAAGGNENINYPWGNELPDTTRVNADRYTLDVSPVGTHPSGTSPFGVMDMCGNVWEWTDNGQIAVNQETDNDSKTIRGGSWRTSFSDIGIDLSGEMNIDEYSDDVGFRCVYSEK